MPQTVAAQRGAPAIKAMLIAVLVTAVVLGAVALVVWAWPGGNDGTTVTSTGFGAYAPGNPPVMGDIHYTPPTVGAAVSYDAGSPPIMRDPQATNLG